MKGFIGLQEIPLIQGESDTVTYKLPTDLTMKELAAYLRCDLSTVYRLRRRGMVGFHLGSDGHWRWTYPWGLIYPWELPSPQPSPPRQGKHGLSGKTRLRNAHAYDIPHCYCRIGL